MFSMATPDRTLKRQPPSPELVWGTKAGGERAVLANSQHMVVRTIVLYGHAPGARPNFVSWLWRELREGRRVRAATDQWGNPTLADDLAAALRGLTEAGASGLVHYGGSSFLTRYEMALAVADALALQRN